MEKIINLHTHIHLNYRIMGEKKLNNNSSFMASPPPPLLKVYRNLSFRMIGLIGTLTQLIYMSQL